MPQLYQKRHQIARQLVDEILPMPAGVIPPQGGDSRFPPQAQSGIKADRQNERDNS
jgi:hypothetical protein